MLIINANRQCQQPHNHIHYHGIPVTLRFKGLKCAFLSHELPKGSGFLWAHGKRRKYLHFYATYFKEHCPVPPSLPPPSRRNHIASSVITVHSPSPSSHPDPKHKIVSQAISY